MSRNSKSVKLFNLEERKTTSGAITEIDIFQWQQTLLDNLRRNLIMLTIAKHLPNGVQKKKLIEGLKVMKEKMEKQENKNVTKLIQCSSRLHHMHLELL